MQLNTHNVQSECFCSDTYTTIAAEKCSAAIGFSECSENSECSEGFYYIVVLNSS